MKLQRTILVLAMVLSLVMALFPSVPVGAQGEPALTLFNPSSGEPGTTLNGVVITGKNLSGATSLNFSGMGVTASIVSANETDIIATIDIGSNAPVGPRDVTVVASGGTSQTLEGGFSVTPLALISLDAPANVAPVSGFYLTARIVGACYLNAFSLHLKFDPAVVQMAGIDGQLGDGSGIMDGEIDSVAIPIFDWTYQPEPGIPSDDILVIGHLPDIGSVSGSGYLTKIHFNVIGKVGAQTQISASAVDLVDFASNESFPVNPSAITVTVSDNPALVTQVATLAPGTVFSTQATLNGQLISFGTATSVNLFVGYSLEKEDLILWYPVQLWRNSATPVLPLSFSAKVKGLSPAQHYYCIAQAQYNGKTVSGVEMEFTTPNPGPPSKIGFDQQPTNTSANVTMTPAVTVQIMDSVGNVVVSDNSTQITLAIENNPGNGSLSGNTTRTTVLGVATFNNLSINNVGTGYTLIASCNSTFNSITSDPFNIVGPPNMLAFGQQPTSTSINATMTPPVTVQILDAAGNVVPDDNSTLVTLVIGNNPSNGTLSGNTTRTTALGIATFDNLFIDKIGAGYTLVATSNSTFDSITSQPFNIFGLPNMLKFAQQPTSTSANATITPPVTVQIVDASGIVVGNDNSTLVTLAIGNNPSNGTLSGNTTLTTSLGVATFDNLSIDNVGTGYTFIATSNSTSGNVTSNSFNIFGPPNMLKFAQQPTSTSANATISPPVTVQILDATGNLVVSENSTQITLAMGNNPSNGTLSGNTTRIASLGVAIFDNLSIDNVGTGYTLIATSNSTLDSITSDPFNIVGPPNKQSFGQQPTSTSANVTMNPAVTVLILDAAGNVVPDDNSTLVTLVIGNNPANGTLSGNTTRTTALGVATFNNLSIDNVGTGYTLIATSNSTSGNVTSSPFNIVGPPNMLAFGQQPTSTSINATMTPPVTVQILDAAGNVVPDDNSTLVTLVIGNNPSNGTLSGNTTRTTALGIATFDNLFIDKIGAGYTLVATSNSTFDSITSQPFNIFGLPNMLKFAQQPTSTSANATITPPVTVQMVDASGIVVGNDNSTLVTLAIGNNPSNGTLSGNTTLTTSLGVATFDNLSIDNVGTGYTFIATSNSTSGNVTSNSFNIFGPPNMLKFAQQPTSTSANATISPAVTVQIQDASGNLVVSDNATQVTLAIDNNPSNGTLSGNATRTASMGVATFDDLSINNTGTGYTLIATATSISGNVTSDPFNIVGPPNKLAFGQQPASTSANATITPAVTVKILDVNSNPVVSDNSTQVTLAIGNNPSNGNLSGNTTRTVSLGVATFDNLSIDNVGTGYTLIANSDSTSGNFTSLPFNIFGPPNKLAFEQQPTNTSANATMTPAVTVQIQDASGNLVVSDNATQVTLVIGNNPSNGNLSGNTTRTVSLGVATFDNLSIDTVGTGYTLIANSDSTSGNFTSLPFNIFGPSNKLAFEQQPTSTSANATMTPAVTVQIQDASGNLVVSDSSTLVTLAIGNNPSNGNLSGNTTRTVSLGVATFDNLSIDTVGTGYTLIANSDSTSGNFTSLPFNIFGPPNKLAFEQQPTSTSANATMTPAVTVQIQDASGNLVVSDSSTLVTLAIGNNPSNGNLSGNTTRTVSLGVATFDNLSIDNVGTGYTLIANSDSTSGNFTSLPFNIFGPPNKLAFEQQPTSTSANATMTPAVTVQIQDASGNLVVSDSSTLVTLAIGNNPSNGNLSGNTTRTVSLGVATFDNLSIDTVGTGYTLIANSDSTSGNFTSLPFNIFGRPNKLAFEQQPTDTIAGDVISPPITVLVLDNTGNLVVSDDSTQINLAIDTNPGNGNLSGNRTVTVSKGIATFNDLSIDKTGTGYTLVATSIPEYSGATSNTFDIAPKPAYKLGFTQQPTDATEGAVIYPPITVQILDIEGNLVTSDNSTQVKLEIEANPVSGTLSGNTTIVAVKGVATFSGLSINKAGSYTLKATSIPALNSDTSISFNIISSSANKLDFVQQPASTRVGTVITPAVKVRILDAQGNLVANDNSTQVKLIIGNNPGGGTLSGNTTAIAVMGVATFSNISINKAGADYNLVATSIPAYNPAVSAFFNIFDQPSMLKFVQQPSSTAAKVIISPAVTVLILDANRNAVLDDNTTKVTLAIDPNPEGATLSGNTTVTVSQGVATFNDLSIDKKGANYTLKATSIPELTPDISNPFNIDGHGVKLAFGQQPSNVIAGNTITPAVTVLILDQADQVVSDDNTTQVTLSIVSNPGSGTLSGNTTVTASNGIAAFNNLSIDKVGTGYTLKASSIPTMTNPVSVSFNVTLGTANKLAFNQQPLSATAGTVISPPVTVQILDKMGNLVTSDSTTQVTVAIDTNPAGGILSGTNTVTASAGVATFNNLSINVEGTGYTLKATSNPALTPAISGTFNITAASIVIIGGGGGGGFVTLPVINSVDPAKDAVGVAVSSMVKATFSTAMDSGTLTTSTFTLSRGATAVAGAVTYDSSTLTATFTPAGNLDYSTTYAATVTTGVRSTNGYYMSSAYSWSFTTMPAPAPTPAATTPAVTTTKPVVTSTVPVTTAPTTTTQPTVTTKPSVSPAPSTTTPVTTTQPPTSTPKPPTGGSNWWWITLAIIGGLIVVGLAAFFLNKRFHWITKIKSMRIFNKYH